MTTLHRLENVMCDVFTSALLALETDLTTMDVHGRDSMSNATQIFELAAPFGRALSQAEMDQCQDLQALLEMIDTRPGVAEGMRENCFIVGKSRGMGVRRWLNRHPAFTRRSISVCHAAWGHFDAIRTHQIKSAKLLDHQPTKDTGQRLPIQRVVDAMSGEVQHLSLPRLALLSFLSNEIRPSDAHAIGAAPTPLAKNPLVDRILLLLAQLRARGAAGGGCRPLPCNGYGSQVNVRHISDMNLRNLEQCETDCDIRISHCLRDRVSWVSIFYSLMHLRELLMYEMVRRVAAPIGLSPQNAYELDHADVQSVPLQIELPVHLSIIESYPLNYLHCAYCYRMRELDRQARSREVCLDYSRDMVETGGWARQYRPMVMRPKHGIPPVSCSPAIGTGLQ